MDKLQFARLWDVYGGLLTPAQREITKLYFDFDLTLSEIAEEKGITRQGVSECLKTCKKQLEDYEEKLGFLSYIQSVYDWARELGKARPELGTEIENLKNILKRG